MHAESIDAGRLACTGDAADAYADAVTAIWQTLVDNLLRLRLMVGIDALHQCHGLREDGDIALDDALHHLGGRELATAEAVAVQVGVYDGRLLYAAVHLQTCIFCAVLGMFHVVLFGINGNGDLRLGRVVSNHEDAGTGANLLQFVAHGGKLQFRPFTRREAFLTQRDRQSTGEELQRRYLQFATSHVGKLDDVALFLLAVKLNVYLLFRQLELGRILSLGIGNA